MSARTANAGTAGWRTTLWLATTGGRSDRVRIALTAVGAAAAALALLAAATVAVTGAGDGPYTGAVLNQPGLHPGIGIALVLICVPVLAFAGQCSRIGAPARDRRLAAFRLSGATPGEVSRVAATETGLAALLGSAAGLGLYFLGRVLLGDPVLATYELQRDELVPGGLQRITEVVTGPALRLPTDVLPPAWVLAALVLAVPVLAALLARLALRRVTTTPFGVVRRVEVRPVQVLPAALFVAGTAGMALFAVLARVTGLDDAAPELLVVVFLVLFGLTAVGLVLGAAATSARIGSWLSARAGRPALLLAGRRLVAAPFAASRAHAALLVVVLLAAAVQGFRAHTLLSQREAGVDFYANALDMVDLALVVAGAIAAAAILIGSIEGVVTRRRTMAALTAAGVPRGVLGRAVLLEVLLPLVSVTLLAVAAGILAARGVLGTTVRFVVQAPDSSMVSTVEAVPVPWAALAVITGLAVVGTALLTSIALPFVRRSTDPGELRTG